MQETGGKMQGKCIDWKIHSFVVMNYHLYDEFCL